MIIEKNRVAYSLGERSGEKDILTIVHEEDGWKTLAVGWPYQHWYKIGERGGLAEAGELKFEGHLKTKIEQYIETYRALLTRPLDLSELFHTFEIEAVIQLNKSVNEYEEKKKKELLNSFAFNEIVQKQYVLNLTIENSYLLKEAVLSFNYYPNQEIAIHKPTRSYEQIALF